MFKLSSDFLANFRGIQSVLQGLSDKIGDILFRLGNVEDTVQSIPLNPGSSSGATDHGALTGLSDDDHTQYHNNARGDARYSQLGHTHTSADVTDLGDCATLNVGTTAGTVAAGDHVHTSTGECYLDEAYPATNGGTWTNDHRTVEGSLSNIMSHQYMRGDGELIYFEVVADNVAITGADQYGIGVCSRYYKGLVSSYVGAVLTSWGYYESGKKWNNGSGAAYGNTFTTGDIIGIAVNQTTGKVWFAKNNTWQNSGNPSAGTNEAYSSNNLKRQLHIHMSTFNAAAKLTIRGVASQWTYSPPAGFGEAHWAE